MCAPRESNSDEPVNLSTRYEREGIGALLKKLKRLNTNLTFRPAC